MAAPKRQPHDLVPPTTNAASSDSETEDQEHSGSSSSSSSSSDDSEDSQPQQLNQSKPQKPPKQTSPSSDSSDSDSDSSPPDKTQKILSPEPKKPTSQLKNKVNAKRPAAETEEVEEVSKNKKNKANAKRQAAETEEEVSKNKKKKKKSESVEKTDKGSKKKNSTMRNVTRLFTEKDEIVLFQAMIDFKSNKGVDPSSDLVAFQESVKHLLSSSVTKSQIAGKIKRLKMKFLNSVKRGGHKDGEDPVFSKPHEYKSFELSKKIWGSDARGSEVDDGDTKVKSSSKKKDKKKVGNVVSNTPSNLVGKKESNLQEEVKDKMEVETEDCWSLYPCLCASLEFEAIEYFTTPMRSKEYVKEVVSGLEREKARELEQEWRGFRVMEHQLYAKRAEMISKQTEAVTDVIQP